MQSQAIYYQNQNILKMSANRKKNWVDDEDDEDYEVCNLMFTLNPFIF